MTEIVKATFDLASNIDVEDAVSAQPIHTKVTAAHDGRLILTTAL